ncbi:TPA: ribonuclease HII [Candidatus Kaiserbacteria bacterium]|nr:MAG: Ribonuclease HII [Parcubacteria group bacterium GW2011_GWA1_56_13]KKW45338.1 MAG: Ribonuclease HII [Parcubacteria group bacterium GW2011_GWB1_57_6]HCR52360.1 ribonuclease HII [Candidatus Kaiserbacteria bacterium]
MKYVLGVDEAGRGPLAGPIAIGVVAVPERFIIGREFPGLADSKQMTPVARAKMFRLLQKRARAGDLRFCVRCTGAERIDAWGLTRAIFSATARAVRHLAPKPDGVSIYLDGLLKAPEEYDQQTIIGGDEAVPIIALASIAAKVVRDRLMMHLAKQFPEYEFEKHKGYGTKEHYEALSKHGPCAIHRRSFIGL